MFTSIRQYGFVLAGGLLVLLLAMVYLGRSDSTSPQASDVSVPVSMVFSSDDIKLVKELKSPNGTILGELYVTPIQSTDVFTSLYVSKMIDGKNFIIYKIESDGFFGAEGKEIDFGMDNFYGFQFGSVGDDYFSLHGLADNGKTVSDDIVIKWHDDTKVFSGLPPSLEEMGSVLLHTLTASDGSVVGKIYVSYFGDKQFSTIHIMKKIGNRENAIYEINDLGFYDTVRGTKELSISPENFYSFQITSIEKDSFIVRSLYDGGNRIGGDFTVRWNADKHVFEVTKT